MCEEKENLSEKCGQGRCKFGATDQIWWKKYNMEIQREREQTYLATSFLALFLEQNLSLALISDYFQ